MHVPLREGHIIIDSLPSTNGVQNNFVYSIINNEASEHSTDKLTPGITGLECHNF